MLITDVRAHHIRIPYDAGVASFRQGASAIAALEIVLVEVSTDAGVTGWGDAFAYVSPKTTRMAVEEMIAPQARGLEVPDAAGIPAFMEQVQRNLHLFGRYGITMFAISGLDIALWDLAAKVKGVPLHRLIGDIKRTKIPAYASLLRIGKPELIAGECRGGAAARLFRDQAARDHATGGVRRTRGDRRRYPADGRHELPDGRRPRRSPSRIRAATPSRCSSKNRCGRRRILQRWPRCAPRAGSISRRERMPAPCINSGR